MAGTTKPTLIQPMGFLAGLLAAMAVGYVTYFQNYELPTALFWDENYHIASAQKYLNSVFFMEPHPPLGKLLLALGEFIVSPNFATDQFVGTDFARNIPPGFSMAGLRFFPALLAWLAGGVLYLLFYEITNDGLKAFLFSCPYIFDNALIVHTRGAMLEGPQLFFLLLFFLFLKRQLEGQNGIFGNTILGVAMGAAISIKVNSLFILPLPLLSIAFFNAANTSRLSSIIRCYAAALRTIALVWEIHFALGQRVNPNLPNKGYYAASDAFRTHLGGGKRLDFFSRIQDNLKFAKQYTAGVPAYDPNKPGEMGSRPALWPIGVSSILYRWEGTTDSMRYLVLQSNPVGWLLALISVLFLSSYIIFGWISPSVPRLPIFGQILIGSYWAYMITVLSVTRVLYLYHYFIPLSLGYASVPYAYSLFRKDSESKRLTSLIVLVTCLLGSYVFFSPLTYYKPLTSSELRRRELLSAWKIECKMCGKKE